MDITPITILRISIGITLLAYVGYCLANQRVWVRGNIGLESTVFAWGTKEENKFVFRLHIIIGTLIGIFLIASTLF